MPRCLYNSSLSDFIDASPKKILGEFACNYHGTIMTTTNEAWEGEIDIMQAVLSPWREEPGQIIFEYDIPRLGKRIDVVLLLRGLIFCLEFKVGEKDLLQADIEQVLDYALDLKNFHLLSRDRSIVPVLIPTKYRASSTELKASVYDDSIYNPLVTGASGLQNLIKEILVHAGGTNPRIGMVICVPTGNHNKKVGGFPEDSTRLPEFYDGTYEYLRSLGIKELADEND